VYIEDYGDFIISKNLLKKSTSRVHEKVLRLLCDLFLTLIQREV